MAEKAAVKAKVRERARILDLRVRNVKCIREVAITEMGDILEIRGDAGQGKTAILDSIEAAFRGLDPDMVRRGEAKAEIELHLTAGMIDRIVNADGASDVLMVTDAEGNRVDRAPEFLRTIVSESAFRPVAWVQLGGGEARGRTERRRKQRDQLIEAIPMSLDEDAVVEAVEGLGADYTAALSEVNLDGVEFEQHAFLVCREMEKACYEYRKLQNSRAEDAEAALKNTPAPERAAPSAAVEVLEAKAQAAAEAYYAAKGRVDSRGKLPDRVDTLREEVAEGSELPSMAEVEDKLAKLEKVGLKKKAAVEGIEEEIAELEAALAAKRKELEAEHEKLENYREQMRKGRDLKRQVEEHQARIADLERLEAELAEEGGGEDLEGLQKAWKKAAAEQEARKLQDKHDAAAEKARVSRERAEVFTRLVKLFRDEMPKRLLEQAALPVEGLSFDEENVLIGNVPLHQLGTSQQIRVGVLVASALNPGAGFVLIDGAESLGREDRAALADVATEEGLQLIFTYVDPDAEPGQGRVVMAGGERRN